MVVVDDIALGQVNQAEVKLHAALIDKAPLPDNDNVLIKVTFQATVKFQVNVKVLAYPVKFIDLQVLLVAVVSQAQLLAVKNTSSALVGTEPSQLHQSVVDQLVAVPRLPVPVFL
jgi:hypothetical protein